MKILQDIGRFISALTFADIIFFFAVVVLMILVVTLVYFIKINNEDEENLDETKEMKIAKDLAKNMKNETPNIEFTDYEKDQENKAIISYDELLNKSSNYKINYEQEDVYDDLSVKKVNLDQILTDNKEKKQKMDVRVISFAEEEAFLKTLKQLEKALN